MRRSLLLALPALCLLAGPARALPFSFAVDTAASQLEITVSVLGSDATAPVELTGTAQADLTLAAIPPYGTVATALQLAGAAVTASDQSFTPALPAGFSLTLTSTGLGASLTGPAATGFPVAPGISLFDFRSAVFSLDAGTLSAVGQLLVTPVNVSVDLSLTPLDFTLPLNSIGQVEVGSGGGLSVSIPIERGVTISFPDLDVDLTLSGELVLESVPEPGTLLLLAVGLLAAGWTSRRR